VLRRDHARSIPGKSQLFIDAFARALEVIPRQLADNSGFDATGGALVWQGGSLSRRWACSASALGLRVASAAFSPAC
jgi:hypothetical protein